MRRILSITAIIVGISLFLYPAARGKYYEHQQKKLIESWKRSLQVLDTQVEASKAEGDGRTAPKESGEGKSESRASDTKESVQEMTAQEEARRQQQKQEEARQEKEKRQLGEYIASTLEGMLKIDKINLYLPILPGVTEDNLNISVASIENTGKPGKIGNYSIAGHRVQKYGQHFNRLDEVEIGDVIEIEDREKTYKYVVFNKFLVDPKETWVINRTSKTEREVTLITCYPLINPTRRLIIKGRIPEGTQ